MQDVALSDLDGDGLDGLVVLEGGSAPGDAGEMVAIWRWHGWSFQLEWRSPPGCWDRLCLQDLTEDSRPEVVAIASSHT